MSLWTDARVKELMARVSELERLMVHQPIVQDPMEDTATELAALYEKKFGKKPHHFMKPASIREALK